MGSLNKVMLIGNCCAAPELRYLPSGKPVCELRVATNEVWKDAQGVKQEKAEFHKIVAWDKLGENCAKYLAKGRQVYIEGRIQTRTYQDKETNATKYFTEIVASQVTFLGAKGESPSANTFEEPHTNGSQTTTPAVDDSDVPF